MLRRVVSVSSVFIILNFCSKAFGGIPGAGGIINSSESYFKVSRVFAIQLHSLCNVYFVQPIL